MNEQVKKIFVAIDWQFTKKHLFSTETNDFLLGSKFEKRKGLDLRIGGKTKQSRSHRD